MTIDRDDIGRRGEFAFEGAMFRAIGGQTLFEQRFLGEKWPLFDFLIEVRGDAPFRPFAFVSVRATGRGRTAAGRLRVGWTRREIEALQAHPAPTYLVGVDLRPDPAETFILSANGEHRTGLSRISTGFPLSVRNLVALADELRVFWADRPAAFDSRFRVPGRP